MESKIFLYDSFIGGRLRLYRQKRGLTQKALGKRVGISAQQLQKYEMGRNRVSASRLRLIAEVLDTPIHFLMMDPKDQDGKNSHLPDAFTNSDVNKLVQHYLLIRSEKARRHLLQTSALYVESGL